MFSCEVFECLQSVVNEQTAVVCLIFRVVYDGIRASFLQRTFREFVTVEGLTLQCQEDASLRTVAAVGGYQRVFAVEGVHLFYIQGVHLF